MEAKGGSSYRNPSSKSATLVALGCELELELEPLKQKVAPALGVPAPTLQPWLHRSARMSYTGSRTSGGGGGRKNYISKKERSLFVSWAAIIHYIDIHLVV